MKKSLLFISLFSSLIFLVGCASDEQVELLKQQNILLQQQVNQQKAESNTTDSTSSYNTNTTSRYDSTPTKSTNYNTSSYDSTPTPSTNYDTPSQSSCCKICSKGKACGDSCISRSYTCHKGVGCACDG